MDGGKMRIERSVRSLEEVQEFIEHAKLHDDDLLPESQILYFDNKGEDYKVLELNLEVQKAFTEGLQVVLRGENNKKAVLCTDCHTFELLEAETSNSSLLIPNLNLSVNNEIRRERHLEEKLIAGVFYSYYELRKIKPPFLHNLRALLNACPYRGPEHEQMSADSRPTAQRLYSTNDLLNICQASSEELNQALDSIGAFNIDGYWRLLHFDYHLRVFSQLLNLVSSNSWPLDGVPETETVEALGDIFPKVVIQHVFSLFTKPTYERNEDGDGLYSLIEYNVCRFLGEALLHDSAGSGYNLDEFTEAWQSSVPDGMTTSLDQLRGVAVVFENNNVQQIKLCLEQDLPNNIHERIDRLFSVKSKWTLDEITPYIKPLLPEKSNVKTTIMKYAQESTVNNIKWYSRRP